MISYRHDAEGRVTVLWWEDGIPHILGRYREGDREAFTAWVRWLYRAVSDGVIDHPAYAAGYALLDGYSAATKEARLALPLLTKLAHIRARASAKEWWGADIGMEPYTSTDYLGGLRQLEAMGALDIVRVRGDGYRPGLGRMNRYRPNLDAAAAAIEDSEAESQHSS